jgi:hypothetical protein
VAPEAVARFAAFGDGGDAPLPQGYRTAMRYRSRLLWAGEHFSDLKDVRSVCRCSSGLLHRVLYEQLELKRRTRLYDWPTKVGIDEHPSSAAFGVSLNREHVR